MSTRARETIMAAIRTDIESVSFFPTGNVLTRDSADVLWWSDTFPMCVIHHLGTSYTYKSGAVRFMNMTVGLSIFTELQAPHWTILGDGTDVGLLALQDNLSDRYTPSGGAFSGTATDASIDSTVHNARVLSHGDAQLVTIPKILDPSTDEAEAVEMTSIFRSTTVLTLDNYQT